MPHHPIVYTADLGALFALFGTAYGSLPTLALILPCVWYSVLIWDRFNKRK